MKINKLLSLTAIIVGALIVSQLCFKNHFSLASANNTAGWKTYTDSAHGLSFQYPPDFTLAVGTNDVNGNTITNIEADGPNGEIIAVYTNDISGEPYMPPQGTNVSDWVINNLKYQFDSKGAAFDIAGLPTLHLVVGSSNQFFVIKNNNLFHITVDGTSVNLANGNAWYVNFLESITFAN